MALLSLDLNGTVARAGAAVVATDGAGRISLWNPRATTLLGYLPCEVMGRLICDVCCPISMQTPTLCYAGCHVRAVSHDATMQRVDIRTRTKRGALLGLSVNALVIPGTPGRGPTVVHLFRERLTGAGASASANGHAVVGGQTDGALTRREIDVLRLMGAGMNTKAIAGVLGVSGATVRNHVQSILGKLAVHSRLAAVAAANRLGLLGGAFVNGRA
jgi:DNA-binding CsgD family transcriptional regulator